MSKSKIKGALLAQGQETSAHCSPCFRNSKLYKIRLVNKQPTLFGEYSYSEQYQLLAKAMKDDLYKEKELKFRHPNDSEKEYVRHYISSPVNGNAFLAVGQFKNDKDFAFVRILLKSAFYGEPYLVLEKYAQSFRNPDILAKMVERAFNWVLRGKGVEIKLEPWEPDEQVMWLLDYEESYLVEMEKAGKEELVMVGYEDALEYYMKQQKEQKQPKKGKKSANKTDRVENYISKKVRHRDLLLAWLDENVKDKETPIDMMRPVRLLMNKRLITGMSISAFNARYHKEGLISVSSFNNYTNDKYVCFENDMIYDDMEKNFEVDMYI